MVLIQLYKKVHSKLWVAERGWLTREQFLAVITRMQIEGIIKIDNNWVELNNQ